MLAGSGELFAHRGAKLQVMPLGFTGGGCTPVPTVSTQDAGVASQGRLCNEAESSGAGCTNGGLCAPAAQGNGFSLCIVHDGIEPCPLGFTQPAHTVGTGIDDARGCTTCSCGSATATCANATLTLFTNTTCDDAGASVPADGKCDPFPGPTGGGLGGGPTYVAYEYTAQAQNVMCPPSPVSPDGGVTLTVTKTVCCQ